MNPAKPRIDIGFATSNAPAAQVFEVDHRAHEGHRKAESSYRPLDVTLLIHTPISMATRKGGMKKIAYCGVAIP